MSKELQQSLSGQATAEQIAAWKKSHPAGIFALKNKNGKISYFKRPSWTEASYLASKIDTSAPLEYIKEAAQMLFIGGEKSMIEEDSELIGVVITMRDQINGVQAEVVNL